MANLYRKKQGELRTSSDGQKIQLRSTDTIFANYSGKYFKKGKGIVSYTFVDERYIPFYSVIIDAAVREATFVLDGLLHNDAIKSTIHTTDTHGCTEAVFGLTDLLGFGFCPNIAKMLRQNIYTFKENPIADYKEKGYLVLPKNYIKEELIKDNWDDVLRLITSLKLKYCTASEIFTRWNSYSKQHPLSAALKEYGKLAKTLHILRFTDDLERNHYVESSRLDLNSPIRTVAKQIKSLVYAKDIGLFSSVAKTPNRIKSFVKGNKILKIKKEKEFEKNLKRLENFKKLMRTYPIEKSKFTFLLDERLCSAPFLKYLAENNFNVLDYGEKMDASKKQTTLVYDQHWSKEGRKIVANLISDYICNKSLMIK